MPTRSKKKSKRVAVKITNFKNKRLRAVKARRVRKARFPKALTNEGAAKTQSQVPPVRNQAPPSRVEEIASLGFGFPADPRAAQENAVPNGQRTEFPGSGEYPTYEEFTAMMDQAKRAGVGGIVISFGTADLRSPEQKLHDLQLKIAQMVDAQMGAGGSFAAEVAEVLSLFPGIRL